MTAFAKRIFFFFFLGGAMGDGQNPETVILSATHFPLTSLDAERLEVLSSICIYSFSLNMFFCPSM
jgi:hypothetical protein